MQDMVNLAKEQELEPPHAPRVVQLLSPPYLGLPAFTASPAQFGPDISGSKLGIHGAAVLSVPPQACGPVQNPGELYGKVAIVERGGCMFVEKAAHCESAGALGVVVVDHVENSSAETQPLFAMSGDGGKTKTNIPSVFMFRVEGLKLLAAVRANPGVIIRLADSPLNPHQLRKEIFFGEMTYPCEKQSLASEAARLPPATPEEPKFIQIYRNEEGFTCMKSDGQEEQCFQDEDLSVIDKIQEKGSSEIEEIISPYKEQTKLPVQPPKDEVLLETPTVKVSVGPDGVHHLKFKFAGFLPPPEILTGDKRNEVVAAILARLTEETNLLSLPEKFAATVERITRISAGEDIKISREDDANLSQLATLLRAAPGNPQEASIPASPPSSHSPPRESVRNSESSSQSHVLSLRDVMSQSEAPQPETITTNHDVRCEEDSDGNIRCTPKPLLP